MCQNELAYILRSAATISGDPDILVIGSQSVLGTYTETQLPEDAYLSVEADLAWPADADPATAVNPPRLATFSCITGIQHNRIRRFLDRAESALAEQVRTPPPTRSST